MKAKSSKKAEVNQLSELALGSQLSRAGRWSRYFLAVAFVPLVFFLAGLAVTRVSSNDTAQRSAPRQLGSFDLPDLLGSGIRHSNASLKGRPAVITVFDKDCVSCKTELPMIEEVASTMKNKVFVLGVDHLDRVSDAQAFVSGLAITFPVAHELTGDLSLSWQLAGLPTTLFVDSRGQEVSRVVGTIARDDLINRIERLS